MALLQISEPGASLDPHRRRNVVGIDLGTTHSLVAAVRNGVAECLPDARRQNDPAFCRSLSGRWPHRDRPARPRPGGADPANTIVSVKRLMGRGARTSTPRRCPTPSSTRPAWCGSRRCRAEVAGRGLGRDPGHAAPARRGHGRRRSVRRRDHRAGLLRRRPAPGHQGRGRLAGLNVLRLINEPTAAAIAYGLDKRPRASSRCTTSAAAPSTSRCCA